MKKNSNDKNDKKNKNEKNEKEIKIKNKNLNVKKIKKEIAEDYEFILSHIKFFNFE